MLSYTVTISSIRVSKKEGSIDDKSSRLIPLVNGLLVKEVKLDKGRYVNLEDKITMTLNSYIIT